MSVQDITGLLMRPELVADSERLIGLASSEAQEDLVREQYGMATLMPRRYHCSSVAELLLRHGQLGAADLREPTGYPRGEPNNCFQNAYLLAEAFPEEFTYCEGVATVGLLSLGHAWVVRDDGSVVDPTWAEQRYTHTRPHATYLGIRFDLAFATGIIAATGYYGLIGGDMVDGRFFTHALETDDGLAVGFRPVA